MNFSNRLPAVPIGIVVIVALLGYMVAQARLKNPEPSPNSSASIFIKGKHYRVKILNTFGITQRFATCSPQDSRDNWVKCSGILFKADGSQEAKYEAWLNTEHLNFVEEIVE
jgi:hypothetical protein